MILPYLLHCANRADKYGNTKYAFYSVKDRLLKNIPLSGYDVQHIPGKRCFTCGGSGTYVGYYWESGKEWFDTCNRCAGSGWFKDPQWICLGIYKYGRYTFHRPLKRHFGVVNPFCEEEIGWDVTKTPVIEGYIDHYPLKFSPYALTILFLLFDFKGFWRRWYAEQGVGWRVYWYWPRNWVYSVIHIIKRGRNSVPFRKLIQIHRENLDRSADNLPF